MMTVLDFEKMKKEGRKISMVTAYDYWTARIVDSSSVDCVLVGDSAAMVMHGYPSTVHATVELMEFHTSAVSRGLTTKFLVSDMPFMSFRRGVLEALDSARRLVQAGAQAVKLEGVDGHEDVVERLVGSGIPVMGHIGLTPQSTNQLGGFRVQGRSDEQAQALIRQAEKLEELGCFALVLECVPAALAAKITSTLKIPTIGIGAGAQTDGQVLVLQDLLGGNETFKPKFLRQYARTESIIREALNTYDGEVKQKAFPTEKESYT